MGYGRPQTPPFRGAMSDHRHPTDGCTLKEALERFAGPGKWQGYERARRAAGSRRNRRYSITFRGEPIAGWAAAEEMQRSNVLIEQRDRAWRDLCFDLISRLRSGELIATGLEEPSPWTGLEGRYRPTSGRCFAPTASIRGPSEED